MSLSYADGLSSVRTSQQARSCHVWGFRGSHGFDKIQLPSGHCTFSLKYKRQYHYGSKFLARFWFKRAISLFKPTGYWLSGYGYGTEQSIVRLKMRFDSAYTQLQAYLTKTSFAQWLAQIFESPLLTQKYSELFHGLRTRTLNYFQMAAPLGILTVSLDE